MKQIDRRIVIIVTFLFIVGLAFGIMKFLIAQKEAPNTRNAIESKRYVKTEKVNYGIVISPVSAPGRVSSISEIDVIAEASGKIITSNIPLKKGSQFKKGDILFTIYPDEAILALKSKKSQFLNSIANILPDLKIDYSNHYQDFRDFFNAIDINKELPKLPDVKEEKLKIYLSSKSILSDYYSILKDELQLSRYTIRAAFDGTYSDVYLEEGAYANIGGKVAHAIRTDVLEIEVPLERFDAQWVKIGDEVKLVSDIRTKEWNAKVVRKSQFVDQNTQSQSVFLRVVNDKTNKLLTGEYLTAHFPGHPIKNAMEIPRNIVFNTNEVFIVNDNRIHKKQIHIIKVNEKTLVFDGLKQGETLVMQPLINVLEGTLVEIQKEEPAQSSEKKTMQTKAKSN